MVTRRMDSLMMNVCKVTVLKMEGLKLVCLKSTLGNLNTEKLTLENINTQKSAFGIYPFGNIHGEDSDYANIEGKNSGKPMTIRSTIGRLKITHPKLKSHKFEVTNFKTYKL